MDSKKTAAAIAGPPARRGGTIPPKRNTARAKAVAEGEETPEKVIQFSPYRGPSNASRSFLECLEKEGKIESADLVVLLDTGVECPCSPLGKLVISTM